MKTRSCSRLATWIVVVAGSTLVQCSGESQLAGFANEESNGSIEVNSLLPDDRGAAAIANWDISSDSALALEAGNLVPLRESAPPASALADGVGEQAAIASSALATAGSGLTISGLVKGTVTSGVNIALSGRASTSVATNNGGDFAFSNLTSGSYTLTPSLAGYGFYPDSMAVTLGSADVTGRTFTSTIPLSNALQAGKLAIYSLLGPTSFASARYTVDGVAYTQQQAQNFILSKLSPLYVYITSQGIRAYNSNYYDQPFTVTQNGDGSISLSLSRADKTPAEIVTLKVKGTAVSVFYSYAWSYRSSGVSHLVAASGEFTGLLWGYPESSWIPSPPYNLRASILADRGVYLTWKDDNSNGTISSYRVYRDGGSTPIATVTGRAYADHAVRTNEDVLHCRNLLCTISYRVVAVPTTGNSSSPSVALTVSSLDGKSTDVPGCRTNADCPSGFACYTDGLCRQQ